MKLRVAVVYGGRSGEHEVSLLSAESVIAALDPDRYDVRRFLIGKDGRWSPGPILPEPGANPGIDVVFPVLHGTFGEDGTVQGLFELAALPYVGPGVLASSAAMDKEVAKRLCHERGLPVVEYLVQWRGALEVDEVERNFQYPVFVKPANLGSSIGISKAHNREELEAALEQAACYDRKVLVERAIAGMELECAVLGNENPRASYPCQILPSREFYDYDDKYKLGKSGVLMPAPLSEQKLAEVRRLAVECAQTLECAGMSRVDFLLESATERVYIN
ncbi:MAG: D-alanine--D-alanine ligase, partial [Acidobacteria bacterium]|nr:D-alanine--D-alanine ligase [Acidobacteriota bacterium]